MRMTRRAWYLLAALVAVVVVGVAIVSAQSPSPAASGASASASPSLTTSVTATPVETSAAASSSATTRPTATPTFRLTRDGSPAEPKLPLTPGATDPRVTQATIGSTICVSGYTATVRPPTTYTTPLKRQQIAEYGYSDTNLADYEEDHLIALEIGGAPRDPANLWPEPYTATAADGTPAGARVKDRFENQLHDGSARAPCASSSPSGRSPATGWRTGKPPVVRKAESSDLR
jgi:hypothetical protein